MKFLFLISCFLLQREGEIHVNERNYAISERVASLFVSRKTTLSMWNYIAREILSMVYLELIRILAIDELFRCPGGATRTKLRLDLNHSIGAL